MDWVKVIAVIQVLGGIHGLIQLIAGASASQAMQGAGIISHTLFACLSGISVIAGILLWFKKRRGFVWSIVLQFLQGVRITFGPGCRYHFSHSIRLPLWNKCYCWYFIVV